MTNSLFVYGTLLFPEVRAALLGREPTTAPAELQGYARYAVRAPGLEPFPVIIPKADGRVEGLLIADLDRGEIDCLDCFENVAGGLYHKLELPVVSAAQHKCQVLAYVAGPRLADSVAEPWDPAKFRQESLASFMRRCFGVITEQC